MELIQIRKLLLVSVPPFLCQSRVIQRSSHGRAAGANLSLISLWPAAIQQNCHIYLFRNCVLLRMPLFINESEVIKTEDEGKLSRILDKNNPSRRVEVSHL